MKSKPRLIVIGGPQSSGKTTFFNVLAEHVSSAAALSEVTPYTISHKKHLGGAFNTAEIELKILETDLLNTSEAIKTHETILVETGIFHCVYAERWCGKEVAEQFWQKYLTLYASCDVQVLYIDSSPETSWQRRAPVYQKRVATLSELEQKEHMRRYKEQIEKLYPLWTAYYKKLPFAKIAIPNNTSQLHETSRNILDIAHSFTS